MAPRKVVVIGAGPVGALAALYAASRGYEVEVYELRSGKSSDCFLANDALTISPLRSERLEHDAIELHKVHQSSIIGARNQRHPVRRTK